MDHPIQNMLKVSLENIQKMIDVDTIVGEAIKVSENVLIIPISKVKMGFAAGGTELKNHKSMDNSLPFGGGTGGTISITPIAFLVVEPADIRVLHLEKDTHLIEKLIDKIPNAVEQITDLLKNLTTKKSQDSNE